MWDAGMCCPVSLGAQLEICCCEGSFSSLAPRVVIKQREMRRRKRGKKMKHRTAKYAEAKQIQGSRENWDLMKNNDKVC